ncbi:MAG: hypothetical protein QNJ97_24975 [Myxococcota bacterium]|nr:hypothetical protein [Myxococcota bacterium]
MAQKVLHEVDAKAVIWCNFDREPLNIYFFTPNAQGKNVFVRSIDRANRDVVAETFAVIVRSWLTTLLVPSNAPITKHSVVTVRGRQEEDSELPPNGTRIPAFPTRVNFFPAFPRVNFFRDIGNNFSKRPT